VTNNNRRHGARFVLQGMRSCINSILVSRKVLLSSAEKGMLRGIAGTIERMLYKDEFWGRSYKNALEEQKHGRK